MTEIYQYPVKATPNGEGGFIGSFRDVPEALTEAESLAGRDARSERGGARRAGHFDRLL